MRRAGAVKPVLIRFPVGLLETVDLRRERQWRFRGRWLRGDYVLALIAASLGVDVRTGKQIRGAELKDLRELLGIRPPP